MKFSRKGDLPGNAAEGRLTMNAILPNLDDFIRPPTPVKRWTLDEYHKLLDCGFFAENEAFELIDGWIIPKCRRSAWHCAVQCFLLDQLTKSLPERYTARNCCAISMSCSEPEPDVAIIRESDRYRMHHPAPDDVLIAIEVCEQNTVARDFDIKMDLYAREGIRGYWIVDHASQEVRIFTYPEQVGDNAFKYQNREAFPCGKTVALVLDGEPVMNISVFNDCET
jgi:Uma2 family endonuclease